MAGVEPPAAHVDGKCTSETRFPGNASSWPGMGWASNSKHNGNSNNKNNKCKGNNSIKSKNNHDDSLTCRFGRGSRIASLTLPGLVVPGSGCTHAD